MIIQHIKAIIQQKQRNKVTLNKVNLNKYHNDDNEQRRVRVVVVMIMKTEEIGNGGDKEN